MWKLYWGVLSCILGANACAIIMQGIQVESFSRPWYVVLPWLAFLLVSSGFCWGRMRRL